MPTVLSVGSGSGSPSEWLEYDVVRLDIDPSTAPDIVANMTALGQIGPYDVVDCSHALEHLYPHEVPRALSEFHRVLKPSGVLVVNVPDLEGVAATEDVLPGTVLSGLHLYYGDAALIEENPHMAHHCGFVSETLKQVMEAAGFDTKITRAKHYNLVGFGVKT